LSPASPTLFNNQNLVTMTPPLEYHAQRRGYLHRKQAETQEGVTSLTRALAMKSFTPRPFKRTIDSLSKRKIQVVPFTVVRGNLTPLVAQLNNKVENVFMVLLNASRHF
jgi:hypothetical protein